MSRNSQFSPEIARRLGDSIFFRHIRTTQSDIDDFVNRAGDYFLNLVENLDADYQAAMVLILLHGNRLSSPIGEEALPASFKMSYGTNVAKIKSALEYMKDSLVKLDRFSGEAVWTVYHPSMLDALQTILSRSPEKIELFLLCGTIRIILAESTTVEDHEHKVFIPISAWYLHAESEIYLRFSGKRRENFPKNWPGIATIFTLTTHSLWDVMNDYTAHGKCGNIHFINLQTRSAFESFEQTEREF